MAYKFQLGEAKLSGSITQTDGSGDLRATTVDSLDASSGGITNAGAIAGATSIDGSGDLTMGTITMTGFSVDSSGNAAVAYLSASSYVSASALDIEGGAQIGGDVLSNGKVYGVTMAAGNTEEFAVSSAGVVSAASLNVDDGGSIGTDSDTDMITLTNGSNIALANDLDFNIAKAGGLQLAGVSVSSTAAELNLLDGAAADTVVNSKAVIYGSAGEVNATSFDISGTEVISSAGNLAVNAIEFDGNIDIANPGSFSLGASMGANTMTLGGSTSTVRVAGDLDVVGTLNRVTETELLIEDKAVIVASGSANAAAAAGAGLVVDIATGDMTFLYQANGENVGGVDASASGDIFVASGSAGLIDVQAAAFYGDGSNLTNVNASGLEETVQTLSSTGTISLASGLQVLADASGGSITLTLPSAGSVEGKMLKIKRSEGSANTVTIDTSAGTIDGESSIILESAFAGVSIISDGTDYYVM